MNGRCIAPGASGKAPCGAPREVGALFCGVHLAAPPGKRGGWISAEKRRRARAASAEEPLDASNIVRRLWVGSVPPLDRHLPDFDVIALCAREVQPERMAFRGQVIRVPLPDSALTDDELRIALAGGRAVALALREQRRVLVTCRAGLNRSAFVAALALRMITKVSAPKVVELMRERRAAGALHNPHFVEYLTRYQRGG